MEISEILQVITAYQNGQQLECAPIDSNDWKLVISPTWNFEKVKYRIKKEKILRQYNNTNEFLAAQKEHGPHLYNMRTTRYSLPVCIENKSVFMWWSPTNAKPTGYSFRDLLNNFEWEDHTPCGIKQDDDFLI